MNAKEKFDEDIEDDVIVCVIVHYDAIHDIVRLV